MATDNRPRKGFIYHGYSGGVSRGKSDKDEIDWTDVEVLRDSKGNIVGYGDKRNWFEKIFEKNYAAQLEGESTREEDEYKKQRGRQKIEKQEDTEIDTEAQKQREKNRLAAIRESEEEQRRSEAARFGKTGRNIGRIPQSELDDTTVGEQFLLTYPDVKTKGFVLGIPQTDLAAKQAENNLIAEQARSQFISPITLNQQSVLQRNAEYASQFAQSPEYPRFFETQMKQQMVPDIKYGMGDSVYSPAHGQVFKGPQLLTETGVVEESSMPSAGYTNKRYGTTYKTVPGTTEPIFPIGNPNPNIAPNPTNNRTVNPSTGMLSDEDVIGRLYGLQPQTQDQTTVPTLEELERMRRRLYGRPTF